MRLDSDAIQIGDRIVCCDTTYTDRVGTVRHVGNIIGKYGIWVGLELDEPIDQDEDVFV